MRRQMNHGCRFEALGQILVWLFFVQWLLRRSLGPWRWSNADGLSYTMTRPALMPSTPGIADLRSGYCLRRVLSQFRNAYQAQRGVTKWIDSNLRRYPSAALRTEGQAATRGSYPAPN